MLFIGTELSFRFLLLLSSQMFSVNIILSPFSSNFSSIIQYNVIILKRFKLNGALSYMEENFICEHIPQIFHQAYGKFALDILFYKHQQSSQKLQGFFNCHIINFSINMNITVYNILKAVKLYTFCFSDLMKTQSNFFQVIFYESS